MGRFLSTEAAKELAYLVYSSNYLLSPYNDGVFDNIIEAVEYIESDEYSPHDCIALCFETTQGHWDSVIVSQSSGEWTATDNDIGFRTVRSNTLLGMINSLRHGVSPDDAYYPTPLTIINVLENECEQASNCPCSPDR